MRRFLFTLVIALGLTAKVGAEEVDHAPCDDVGLSGLDAEWCDPSDVEGYQQDFELQPIDRLSSRNGRAIRVTITGAYDAPMIVIDAWRDGSRRPRLRVHRPTGVDGGKMEAALSSSEWSAISRAAEEVSRLPSLHSDPSPDVEDEIVLCHGGMKIIETRGYGGPRTLLRFACRPPEAATDFVSRLVDVAVATFPRCRATAAPELAECRR
jgi:hypothetical protein